MSSRNLRYVLVPACAALAFAAMMSCSTSSNSPGDPVGPGPGGGGVVDPPHITSVSPAQTCANAGNTVTIQGNNLVSASYLSDVTINGVRVDVIDRVHIAGVSDALVVQTRQATGTLPSQGLLVDVRVSNINGAETDIGAIRLLPACTAAPVVVSISPATGSRLGQEAITISGDNLACVTSVSFVGTRGAGTLPADIVFVTSDQELTVLSPATNNPSNEPYEIVVTSGCGTNSLPRPTFTYTGSGGTGGAIVPDATAILDITSGLPQGPAAGGNTVRLTGRDLDRATQITIGSTTLLVNVDFIVTALGDILVPAWPASPSGTNLTVSLNVVVSDGTNPDPTPVVYTYLGAGAPTCISISPNSGPIAGGTQVTITGTGLNDITRVLFGGVEVDSAGLLHPDANGARLLVTTPAYSSAIDVDVQLQVGDSARGFTTIANCTPARFTYINVTSQQFSVDAIAPEEGPQTGGTTISITGTGLIGVNSVKICNVPATITRTLDTQISATTAAFGGVTPTTCDVVVSTSTGQSATLPAAFTYRPVVPDAQVYDASSATTSPACGGTTFRLNGVSFIGGTRVRFGGSQTGSAPVACDVQFQSNTQVSGTAPQYQTPAGPFPADVNVVVESGAGGDTTPLSFRYYANPTLSFARGAGGTSSVTTGDIVFLTGTNFRPENDVFVGSVELCKNVAGTCTGALAVQFTVVDNTTIQFATPALPTVGDYDIIIRTPNPGRSCTGNCSFTLVRGLTFGQPPSASRVSPSSGPWFGGTSVTITGNFPLPITSVTICGEPQALGTQTATSMQILTRQPFGGEAAAGTPCDVTLTSSLGSDTVPGAFTFIADPDPATVEVASPNCGLLVDPPTRPLPVAVGETLTIRGTDLRGVQSVTIGTAAAVITTATRTDTQIDVTVPNAPAAGGPAFDVTTLVDFGGGITFTDVIAGAVQYQALPTITSIAPPAPAGGQNFTITGTALRNVTGTLTLVTFNGIPATNVQVVNDTTVVGTAPAGVPGAATLVQVSTCQGDATLQYTFPCNVPTISAIAPATGSGGTLVTISGTDLLNQPGGTNPAVSFGAANALPDPLFTQTATTLRYIAPTGSLGALVDVKVTTCGGTATSPQQFQYQCVTPTINSVTPSFGVASTVVTIAGLNLDNPSGGQPIVRFGATPGSVSSVSGTTITVVAPAGAGTVNVSVQNCGGLATSVGAFTYCSQPTVGSLSPASGPPDQLVTITGTNLQAPDGTPATVKFSDGTLTVTGVVVSSTPLQIGVQAPSGLAGVATVTVATCGGQPVNAGQFRFCTAPVITLVAPVTGAAGTQVVITGTDLLGSDGNPSVVRFGLTPAGSILQATATRFVVTVPVGLTGQVSVDLTTCGGTAIAPQLFASCALPTITGLVPSNGPAGTEVTISGSDLIGADGTVATVLFGTTTAILISSTPTTIVAVAPTGFTSNQQVNVRARTCGGTSNATPATVFTYQVATTCVTPAITGISPTAGAVNGQLTISGTALVSNDGTPTIVTFGSSPGVNAVVIAATPAQVVVRIPAGAGAVAVSATTCGGSATSPQIFTYCAAPSITSIAPSSGPIDTVVTITGTVLLGADGVPTTVTFGNTQATVIDATATRLVVRAPAGISAGTPVNVRATTCGGVATSATLYTFVATTTFDVTSIAPAAGPRSGGQLLSISGTGLTNVNSIRICGVPAVSLVIVSDTQVTANSGQFNGSVPSTCDVVVGTSGGQTDTLVASYQYLPAIPDGQTFDPAGAFNAPAGGGTAFQINGNNMLGVNKINFGGRVNDPDACNVQAQSDTRVTGIAPLYTTPSGPFPARVEVFVESAAGVDSSTAVVAPGVLFTYWPNPTLTAAFPSVWSSPADNPVALLGNSLMDPGSRDGFVGQLRIRNAGFSHPTTYPADEFDVFVPFGFIDDQTIVFSMPTPPRGDTYKLTINLPNSALACVEDYEFTLFGLFVTSETNCTDGIDNDGDGPRDCNDGDCEAVAPCP